MSKKSIQKPSINLGFLRNESGSIAVEGAIVASFLAVALVGLMDVKTEINGHRQLSDSLRASAAYINTGGADLDTLRTIFETNFRSAPDSFSTALICMTPPQTLEDGTIEDEQADAYQKTADNLSSASQVSPGTWGSCPNDNLLRFVELSAQHKTKSLFTGRDVDAKARLRLRLYEAAS